MITKKVPCPYCGFKTEVKFVLVYWPPKQITSCSIEDGGCDKDFVFQPVVDISVRVFKIGDQEKEKPLAD
jgi:hypothetical protein